MNNRIFISLAFAFCCLDSYGGSEDDGGVTLLLDKNRDGLAISLESTSIYNSKVMLPIVLASDEGFPGIWLVFEDSSGKKFHLCAHVDYADIPNPALLYFRHKMSVVEHYGILARSYCLHPGRYSVTASYKGVVYGDGFKKIHSDKLIFDIP